MGLGHELGEIDERWTNFDVVFTKRGAAQNLNKKHRKKAHALHAEARADGKATPGKESRRIQKTSRGYIRRGEKRRPCHATKCALARAGQVVRARTGAR